MWLGSSEACWCVSSPPPSSLPNPVLTFPGMVPVAGGHEAILGIGQVPQVRPEPWNRLRLSPRSISPPSWKRLDRALAQRRMEKQHSLAQSHGSGEGLDGGAWWGICVGGGNW